MAGFAGYSNGRLDGSVKLLVEVITETLRNSSRNKLMSGPSLSVTADGQVTRTPDRNQSSSIQAYLPRCEHDSASGEASRRSSPDVRTLHVVRDSAIPSIQGWQILSLNNRCGDYRQIPGPTVSSRGNHSGRYQAKNEALGAEGAALSQRFRRKDMGNKNRKMWRGKPVDDSVPGLKRNSCPAGSSAQR